jgi:hypothetical protein
LQSKIKEAERMLTTSTNNSRSYPMRGCFFKIIPIAFASAQTISSNDSLQLNISLCAVDSFFHEIQIMNPDRNNHLKVNEENSFMITPTKSGYNIIEGKAPVPEKGRVVWKPFNYTYYVEE